MTIGCVLMAAGTSSRFGENKLLYPLNGRSLIEWALAAAPASLFARAVAVVADPVVEAIAQSAGYTCIWNHSPALGQGLSIALGAKAMDGLDAAMYMVADQPYLTRASVEALLAAHAPGQFTALAFGERRGNPVIFPKESFAALAALSPIETGKAVLSQYPEQVALVQAKNESELWDVDAKADLSTFAGTYSERISISKEEQG